VWPFDPSTLTPGLDTKNFSDILKRNLTGLANNTKHNIPLEVAMPAVGAVDRVPLDMNGVLEGHHYVTVPVITVIIMIILTVAVVFEIIIVRTTSNANRQDQKMVHMGKQYNILFEALRNKEEEEERERGRPRKPTAPQPPQPETYKQSGSPSYTAAGRGRPGYATTPQSPDGRPGHSLGASPSLIAGLQEHEASTAGHSLGMHVTGMQGEAASMLGGFCTGRDQVAMKNFQRGAPAAINMSDMMERR
jgi:hypothetical protein